MSKNSKETNESMEDGLGLGLALIILGIIIQFVFWGNDIALWGATICIAAGPAFLGNALEENKEPKTGLDDIGVGILIFLPSFLGLFYFSNTFIKILFLLPLIFGLFGILRGTIKQSKNDSSTKIAKPNDTTDSSKKIISVVVSITGFLSNVATIIALFIR